MIKIKQIPPDVQKRIAAGQVVESPASIVQELLDNAIDAGSTQIDITLIDGGKSKIVVKDNGIGIDKDQLNQAIAPFSTSKLVSSNLDDIQTLGFRGEALASIAAVCSVTISSKTANQDFGYQFSVSNSTQTKSISQVGMPLGTKIEVSNLFQHLPARKKFLRSNQQELSSCWQVIYNYLICYPKIKVTVRTNSTKNIFGSSNIEQRIEKICDVKSEDIVSTSIDLDYGRAQVWLMHPKHAKVSSRFQWLFVNHRPVGDSKISSTIKKAFGHLLPAKKKPGFVVMLEFPPHMVDVNIHPQKKVVKLINHHQIIHSLANETKILLTTSDISFRYQQLQNQYLNLSDSSISKTHLPLHEYLKKELDHWRVSNQTQKIVQVGNLYLAVSHNQGLILIDQHAAHESILYEEYQKSWQEMLSQVRTLERPVTFKLNQRDVQILEQIDPFPKLSILAEMSKDSITIIKAPKIFTPTTLKALISELIDEYQTTGLQITQDSYSHQTLAFLSCRNAIKKGQELTYEQMKNLIEKLANTPNTNTCPHGRPTHYLVSIEDLHHIFNR